MSIRVLVISDYRDFHSTRPEASIFLGLAKMGLEIIIMTIVTIPEINIITIVSRFLYSYSSTK